MKQAPVGIAFLLSSLVSCGLVYWFANEPDPPVFDDPSLAPIYLRWLQDRQPYFTDVTIVGGVTCENSDNGKMRRDFRKDFPGAGIATFTVDDAGNPKKMIGKGIIEGTTPRTFCFAYPVEMKQAPGSGRSI